MGKKSKKEKNKQLEDTTAVLSKKSVVGKPRKQRPKATDAGRTPIGRSSRIDPAREPSDDEIRLRAYFIAERRTLLSLEGDSTHDWIEARRQLIEEGKAARL